MKIKIKKLVKEAVIPEIKSSGAACFDFVCTKIEKAAQGKVILYFGIAVEIPEGYKMVIVPRSSFSHKGWFLANSPAQIDSDYRGELQLRIEAFPDQFAGMSFYAPLPFKVGDRVAQGFIEKVIPVEFEEAEELSETGRLAGGFGSTGK